VRVVNGVLRSRETIRQISTRLQSCKSRLCDAVTHHGDTSSLGPVVPLALGPEERSSGLQQGLVDTSTSSDDSDGSTGQRRDGLLGTGRQPDSGLLVLDRVSDDGSVVTRSSGERTSVPGLLLDVADDGTFGALSDGEDVADVQGGLLSAVDERTGRETLGGDESLLSDLVSVRVSEDNGGQGGTSVGGEGTGMLEIRRFGIARRRGARQSELGRVCVIFPAPFVLLVPS
jgi:hypothetical protein